MKLQGSTLLALRFLRSSTQERTINVMLKACFISILISTFGLTLVAAIMNGFEKSTYQKLQGVHADITLSAQDKPLNYQKIKTVLDSEFAGVISAYSPTGISQIMIKNDALDGNNTQICLLKIIDPEKESFVTTLASTLVQEKVTPPKNPLTALDEHTILIGTALADRLHLLKGSTVTLLYPEDEIVNNKLLLQMKTATVGGIFKTGIADFDEHVILGSFELAAHLFPDEGKNVTQLLLKLKDPALEEITIARLKKRLQLDAVSWKELYPPLMAALILEKYAMIFILALVTLIASMTIISLLFMYVTQKKLDIVLLKIMGMTEYHLVRIFVLISLGITVTATIMGLLLAAIATWLLNKYPFITLPDVYYVSHLPAVLDFRIVISVLLFSVFVGIFAALVPTRTIRNLRITDILKGIPT